MFYQNFRNILKSLSMMEDLPVFLIVLPVLLYIFLEQYWVYVSLNFYILPVNWNFIIIAYHFISGKEIRLCLKVSFDWYRSRDTSFLGWQFMRYIFFYYLILNHYIPLCFRSVLSKQLSVTFLFNLTSLSFNWII